MYNNITEKKIQDIPTIGDIDITRLPQELTRIYAQIVSLRRQIADGTINFKDENLQSGLDLLRKLANNLEIILLSLPNHEQKESIAFVAATANSLILKMFANEVEGDILLEVDTISPFLASTVLFLIGNSQADAAEIANFLVDFSSLNLTQQRLVSCVTALATGRLADITETKFSEEEIHNPEDFQETAVNYLWRELGLGIIAMAKQLTKPQRERQSQTHFDNVIKLAVSENTLFEQRNVFAGPFRLAKLLKMLENDILNRGIVNIPPPSGIDPIIWNLFLAKLAKERPYLWENHKEAIDTGFLDPGISAVLTLPTGAGKTTLSELKLASCIYSGKKAIYLVPTHALEDQVNRNLKKIFETYDSDSFEIDGEYTELGEPEGFPIVVMTPERCLTLISINADFIKSVGLVVFDEFHLVHGTNIKRDRRAIDAMYCLLSLFTMIPQSDYLLISAMVDNGKEICDWVEEITDRRCLLFDSIWKPTRQLHGCLIFEEKEINELKENISKARLVKKTGTPPKSLKDSLKILPHCFFSLKNIWETEDDADYFRTPILDHDILLGISDKYWQLTTNRNDIAAHLAVNFTKLGLKTLIFVDDPRIANSTANKIAEQLTERKNSYVDYTAEHAESIVSLQMELGDIAHSYYTNQDNVGVHHGLLFPIERELIETYFKQSNGSIALVATATLAQGINLPAEVVIIAGDDRYNEDENRREDVKPHELLNAAGRAGRAGQSSQGAVILIPGDIVTIDESIISKRWWSLKNKVFSKGDQCLEIEDPLQYFLDSLQVDSEQLDISQTNVLYKFKAEKLSEDQTKKFLGNSFYAFKAKRENMMESFNGQVANLLQKRNELDNLSEDVAWTKEISFKTGIDPALILELSRAIDSEDFEKFIHYSVVELIEWFFNWAQSKEELLEKIFTKPSAINQIKRVIGLKQDLPVETVAIILRLPVLAYFLTSYVQGMPLNEINELIPNSAKPDKSPYLTKVRNFVIRLVPELSISFGLLSMVIVEKAQQNKIKSSDLPMNIRTLGSCIREGFDDAKKLYFKKDNGFSMRVETHREFSNLQS